MAGRDESREVGVSRFENLVALSRSRAAKLLAPMDVEPRLSLKSGVIQLPMDQHCIAGMPCCQSHHPHHIGLKLMRTTQSVHMRRTSSGRYNSRSLM